MNETMIGVDRLVKRYGTLEAVKGVSFNVKRGEIFALLGPNGSGKTSTLESLEGLRRPDGGRLTVCGLDPTRQTRKLTQVIGVQLQASALPPAMTVEEAMVFFCRYHGHAVRYDLVERLGLTEKRKSQYAKLSTGQQRRLALALAVAHEPVLLFLDEPTAGLDVQSRAELHALIGELQAGGTTVILATHDMAEAEKLADRAAILLHGRIAALDTPRRLTAVGAGRTKITVSTEKNSLIGGNPHIAAAHFEKAADEYAVYTSDNPGPAVTALLAAIQAAGDKLVDLRVERPTLEERFLEITNASASQGGNV
jgi:ABC-2 type transport system ATP-binding protein